MPAFDAEEMQLLQGLSEIPYLLAECIGLQISLGSEGLLLTLKKCKECQARACWLKRRTDNDFPVSQASSSGSTATSEGIQAPTSKDYADLLNKYKVMRTNMLILCHTAQREMQRKLAIIADLK